LRHKFVDQLIEIEAPTFLMRITEASEVARLLDEFGRRALLYGGNPYRAKAYLRAAERVAC